MEASTVAELIDALTQLCDDQNLDPEQVVLAFVPGGGNIFEIGTATVELEVFRHNWDSPRVTVVFDWS